MSFPEEHESHLPEIVITFPYQIIPKHHYPFGQLLAKMREQTNLPLVEWLGCFYPPN